jgi:hypothetical protein
MVGFGVRKSDHVPVRTAIYTQDRELRELTIHKIKCAEWNPEPESIRMSAMFVATTPIT